MERILQNYRDHLSIVDRVGHYYRTPFKVHLGVTHGYPLFPIIFNIVDDVVIFHWFPLVAGEDAGPDRFRWAFQCLVVLFYTQAGLDPSGSGCPDGIVRQGGTPDKR